jgi:hypothetical protein
LRDPNVNVRSNADVVAAAPAFEDIHPILLHVRIITRRAPFDKLRVTAVGACPERPFDKLKVT